MYILNVFGSFMPSLGVSMEIGSPPPAKEALPEPQEEFISPEGVDIVPEDSVKICTQIIKKQELLTSVEKIKAQLAKIGTNAMVELSLSPGNEVMVLSYISKDKIKYAVLEKKGLTVGEGSMMCVKKVKKVSLDTFKIKYKASKCNLNLSFISKHQTKWNEDILNHNLLTGQIHKDVKIEGIVKPHLVTNGINNIGVFSKYFESSLFNCIRLYDTPDIAPEKEISLIQVINGFRHLLQGVKKMHELKICHKDIKPSNILFDHDTFKLTDFGGARSQEQINGFLNDPSLTDHGKEYKILGSITTMYSTWHDLSRIRESIAQKNLLVLMKVLEMMDLFAIGKTMFELLTKIEVLWGTLYKRDCFKLVDSLDHCEGFHKEIEDKLKVVNCSEKLIRLIIFMCEPDYSKRPSANTALLLLEEVIKEYDRQDILSMPKKL
jgi:serine/threonine protein kinase